MVEGAARPDEMLSVEHPVREYLIWGSAFRIQELGVVGLRKKESGRVDEDRVEENRFCQGS